MQGHPVELVQIQAAEEALGQIFHTGQATQVVDIVDDGHGADVRALHDLPHFVQRRILVDGDGRAGDHIGHAWAQVRDEEGRSHAETLQDVGGLTPQDALAGGDGVGLALEMEQGGVADRRANRIRVGILMPQDVGGARRGSPPCVGRGAASLFIVGGAGRAAVNPPCWMR